MTQDKPTKTAMMEFIENAKTAKEHSKDGYVTYDEVIEVATELLEKEKTQIVDAFVSGCTNSAFDIEYGELAEKHFNSTCKQ
jgi:Ca2+-binding EF-hand superfamily protein